MADVKKQLSVPELPSVVAGDGRHVMSLLRQYLKEMAIQINLANDFEGEPETDTGLAAPSGFVLKFGVEGGVFSWKDVPYIESLAYYELRTDRNVGAKSGLLERTTENTSTVLPNNYQATVYLYAVTKDKVYSNASVLTYTKARPEAPQKINLTKNEQGTLIQFTEIPLDCIGAHIYVDDVLYTTTDNIYLYPASNMNTIAIAYYDQFGDGEKNVISCVVPDVTGFIVERNGAVLDFYWNPVDLHGVQYTVQIAESPQWGSGTELFTTDLNKKKFEYPNVGNKYFLIKAFDEHGNYSSETVWYKLDSAEDPTRNHIIVFDEHGSVYPNTKFGVWYDAASDGLRLSDGLYTGEYIFHGELPTEYLARNWTDFKVITTTAEEWRVKDALYELGDDWASSLTVSGGRISESDCAEVKTYIATYQGAELGDLFLASLSDEATADTGEIPNPCAYADEFTSGRWGKGLAVKELTQLKYEFKNVVNNFHSSFCIRYNEAPVTGFIAKWACDEGWMELYYDDAFILEASDGIVLTVPYTWKRLDAITFCISQSETERGLYIKTLSKEDCDTAQAAPIGIMTTIQFDKGA